MNKTVPGVGLEVLALAIAKISMYRFEEAFFELNRQLKALIDSGGACERLFNKRMQEHDWREFSLEIGNLL